MAPEDLSSNPEPIRDTGSDSGGSGSGIEMDMGGSGKGMMTDIGDSGRCAGLASAEGTVVCAWWWPLIGVPIGSSVGLSNRTSRLAI